MAYCAYTDVHGDFKSTTFSSTTLVTSTQVTQFIVEADALINSYVGARWETPITADASALALMQLISRTLVADRVRSILENKQVTNVDANANVKQQGFKTSDAMKILQDIKNGEIQISGGTPILANAGFYSNNQNNSVSGTMKKNTKQW